jgi:hypothetical protein
MFKKIIVIVSAGLLLSGCAAIEKSNAMDTERLLSASGFRMKLADTSEKLANIKAMTQRKVVPHIKDGAVYYAYADAEFCKCLYLGTESNYQQYEKIAIERNIAQMNEAAALDWGAWGPWGVWY